MRRRSQKQSGPRRRISDAQNMSRLMKRRLAQDHLVRIVRSAPSSAWGNVPADPSSPHIPPVQRFERSNSLLAEFEGSHGFTFPGSPQVTAFRKRGPPKSMRRSGYVAEPTDAAGKPAWPAGLAPNRGAHSGHTPRKMLVSTEGVQSKHHAEHVAVLNVPHTEKYYGDVVPHTSTETTDDDPEGGGGAGSQGTQGTQGAQGAQGTFMTSVPSDDDGGDLHDIRVELSRPEVLADLASSLGKGRSAGAKAEVGAGAAMIALSKVKVTETMARALAEAEVAEAAQKGPKMRPEQPGGAGGKHNARARKKERPASAGPRLNRPPGPGDSSGSNGEHQQSPTTSRPQSALPGGRHARSAVPRASTASSSTSVSSSSAAGGVPEVAARSTPHTRMEDRMMQLRRDPGSRSAIRQRARGAKLDAAGGGDVGNVVRRNIALASQHTTEKKTKDLAARFERDRKVGVNEKRREE